ncbi:MAG: hypothetical protein IJ934_04425 [Acetobacter sp.]|nr:hypothetical protein [Acetobacter sp.]
MQFSIQTLTFWANVFSIISVSFLFLGFFLFVLFILTPSKTPQKGPRVLYTSSVLCVFVGLAAGVCWATFSNRRFELEVNQNMQVHKPKEILKDMPDLVVFPSAN